VQKIGWSWVVSRNILITSRHAPLQAALGIGLWTHSRAQAANKHRHDLEGLSLEDIDADGPACIHTSAISLGWAKGKDGAAYIVPGWAGRTASLL